LISIAFWLIFSLQQEGSYQELQKILKKSITGADKPPASATTTIHTITRDKWNKMSDTERRRLFATGSIHIIGPSGDQMMTGITSWDDLDVIECYLNLGTQRFVQGTVHFV
jgi:hypothetical protein